VKLVLAAAAALLVPVVLVGAAVGALGGGADPSMPVSAHGATGLAVAAAQAGFTGPGLRLAVAVGLAESDGNPTARGPNPPTPGCPTGSTDRGAWQLNNCYHPEVSGA
jgi:Lysozyme like domain